MKEKNNNSQRFKKNAITGLIVSLLILIAVNILSSFFFFRIDLTKDKRLSLSPTTIQMLKNLDDKVYIRVFLKGSGSWHRTTNIANQLFENISQAWLNRITVSNRKS